MTADTAVTLMLEHEIMTNPLIPVEACPDIATALERMWQVGFEANTLSRTHELPIERHSPDGKVVTYPSLVIAARAHGVDKSTISKAAKGKIKTAAGFKWRYAEVG